MTGIKKTSLLFKALLILLLFTPGSLLAQKTGKLRIDSLLIELPRVKTDTGRCQLYYHLSFTYIGRNPVLALPYADKEMALAKKINWKKGLAQAYRLYGAIYLDRGQYDLALNNLTQSIKFAEEINYTRLLGAAYTDIAICYKNKNNNENAFTYKKKALSYYLKDNNNPDQVFAALINLIDYYWSKKQITEGHNYLAQLLKAEKGNNLYTAIITIIDGDLYHYEDKYKEALSAYQMAGQLTANLNNTNAPGMLMGAYGDYYLYDQKDTLKAIQYYQSEANFYAGRHSIKEADVYNTFALIAKTTDEEIAAYLKQAAIYRKAGSDDEANPYQIIGGALFINKKYNESAAYFKKELDIFNKNNNKIGEAYAYMYIGYRYLQARKFADALKYFNLSLDGYRQMSLYEEEALSLSRVSSAYVGLKDYTNALALLQKELAIAQKLHNLILVDDVNTSMANIYNITHNYTTALKYETEMEAYAISGNYYPYHTEIAIATTYGHMNNYRKELQYGDMAQKKSQADGNPFFESRAWVNIADAYYHEKNYAEAMNAAQKSLKIGNAWSEVKTKANTLLALITRDAPDSVLTKQGLKTGQRYSKALEYFTTAYNARTDRDFSYDDLRDHWREVSVTYEKLNDYNKAHDTYKKYIAYRDSAEAESDQSNFRQKEDQFNFGRQADSIKYQQQLTAEKLKQQSLLVTQQNQSLTINKQQLALQKAGLAANENKLKATQKEQEATQANFELQKTELNAKNAQSRYFIGGLIVLLLLSFFIARNYYNQRKANQVIVAANKEAGIQRAAAEHSLQELKNTQTQLVQAEKLASLGELTAGIAHEIQNPLNFVNNFSDVSAELVDEMEEELAQGDTVEAIAIAHDIKQNLEKIIHHGKRADAIVKNMLQHSRNNSGEKQLTDINALADEYLRLSYHGLRAKDKTFNSHMDTSFDTSLPKITVIPQDIGRVLLNLYNNAFYAVQQKQKTAGVDYRPTVEVSTATTSDFVEVKVKDNGIGIPDGVKDKILQPFFTTKPTGEGTGLGLSLSYDILVKGHGGTIDIDSKEGKFTEFTIRIPV